MTDSGDAMPPVAPAFAAFGVPADALPDVPDDRAARRAALRDLAAMIGVEVFY